MKPRIKFERGVWLCWSPYYQGLLRAGRVIGFGLTPQAAYDHWAGKGARA
ncbi:hypothetical protein [Delftia acidovorans]